MHRPLYLSDLQGAAEALSVQGYVIIPGYDNSLSVSAQDYFSEFLKRWSLDELRTLTRTHEERPDGKYEPDDGFIDWAGTVTQSSNGFQKDVKRMFHYRPDFWKMFLGCMSMNMPQKSFSIETRFLLQKCQSLFVYHMQIALALLVAFDRLQIIPGSFAHAFQECLEYPVATSRSLVRLIDYPSQIGTERARVHFDRSFLTLHAGDEGGELFVRHEDGTEVVVSPKPGEILAFWGAKATLHTKDCAHVLSPVAHGARGAQNSTRRAVVSFWHINHVLWDAPKVPY